MVKIGRFKPSLVSLGIMSIGFAFLCYFLQLRGQQVGRCPITTPSELLVFLSWSVMLLYFLLGRAFRLSLLGAFTAPMVAAFQAIALPAMATPGEHQPTDDYWAELHVPISILAYGAFGLAAIAGIMYLVQNRLLKRAQLKTLSWNLPDIRHLNQAIVRLVVIGLLLLLIGIASGFAIESPPTGLHLALSFAVWAAYAVLLAVKFARGLASQQTAVAAAGVFVFAVVAQLIQH